MLMLASKERVHDVWCTVQTLFTVQGADVIQRLANFAKDLRMPGMDDVRGLALAPS